jgi:hypothetical protein
MGEFKRSRFFIPRPLKFMESAYKRRDAGIMVLAVERCPVPSSKGSLHRKVKKASARVGLETPALNNLAVSDTQLVFQEKVFLEQRKIRRNAKKCFAEMDKVDDLENGIRVEMD